MKDLHTLWQERQEELKSSDEKSKVSKTVKDVLQTKKENS